MTGPILSSDPLAHSKKRNRRAERTRYRKVKIEGGHPLSHSDGQVYAHRAILYAKIGPGDHLCNWCGRLVGWERTGKERLVVDHLDRNGCNNAPSNLVPSCDRCNKTRASRERLTCGNGHPRSDDNLYIRPDGKGRQCRACNQAREKRRTQRRREGSRE